MNTETTNSKTSAQKLIEAFAEFRNLGWRHSQSEMMAGHKQSEIRLLLSMNRCGNPDTPLKVSEISKLLNVTSPTVTQLIKGLEADGLVERKNDPSDRRAVGIVRTDKGNKVIHKAIEARLEQFQELADYLGEEQSNQFADLLLKVTRFFEEKAARAHQFQWYKEDEEV